MREGLGISVGAYDFRKIAKDFYYVDKTSIIASLFKESSGSAFLFTRPRRFGKSLMLSMLDSFFRIDEDNSALFADKKIFERKDIVEAHMNKHPVILLSMKDVYGENAGECLNRTRASIKNLFLLFKDALKSPILDEAERKYARSVIDGEVSKEDLCDALLNLSNYLYRVYGSEAIVLIDEYDTPIRVAYEKGYYSEVIGFFKQLYGAALKGNNNILFAVLTGILQIAKESMFSGLNNLYVNSVVSDDGDEAFGFTEEEVKQLLEYYGYSDRLDEVREWYDGYLFGKNKVYNPLSVLIYVKKEGKAESYWVNTAENATLSWILSSFPTPNSLSALLSGERVYASVNLAISYPGLEKGWDSFCSYLLACGYLTIQEDFLGSTKILKIPNKEIAEALSEEVVKRYLPRTGENFLAEEIKKSFMDGDQERLQSLLEEKLLPSFSYFEFGNEKGYQIMILTLASLLFEDCLVKSETNEGTGRADIVVYPKKENGFGIVIEIKCHKSRLSKAKLKQSSEYALRQIAEKNYDESLKKLHPKSILHFGVSFFQKSVEVSSKRVL